MEDPVADGIRQGRVGEVVVPLGRRDLTGDDGGTVAVAVFEDLEQVPALLVRDRREPQSSRSRTSTRASLASRRT